MIAVALLTVLLASPTLATSTPSASPNWAGYLQYPATASDSWQQVSGEFQIPFLDCTNVPNGAALAVWVGIGGSDGAPQLFQAGITSGCWNAEQVDGVWWTDDLHGYEAQYFIPLQTSFSSTLSENDWISVKLANSITTTIRHRSSKVVRRVRRLWEWQVIGGHRVHRRILVVRRHRVHFTTSVTTTTPGWSATVDDLTSGAIWQGSDTSWVEPANPSADWIVEDPGAAGVPYTCDQGSNCLVMPSFSSAVFSSGSDTSASGAPGTTPQVVEQYGSLQTPQQNEFLCPAPIVSGNAFVVDDQTSPCSQ